MTCLIVIIQSDTKSGVEQMYGKQEANALVDKKKETALWQTGEGGFLR